MIHNCGADSPNAGSSLAGWKNSSSSNASTCPVPPPGSLGTRPFRILNAVTADPVSNPNMPSVQDRRRALIEQPGLQPHDLEAIPAAEDSVVRADDFQKWVTGQSSGDPQWRHTTVLSGEPIPQKYKDER